MRLKTQIREFSAVSQMMLWIGMGTYSPHGHLMSLISIFVQNESPRKADTLTVSPVSAFFLTRMSLACKILYRPYIRRKQAIVCR